VHAHNTKLYECTAKSLDTIKPHMCICVHARRRIPHQREVLKPSLFFCFQEGLSEKLGLVERAGVQLFEALSQGEHTVSVEEAADFLSVNSRGNPLRAATGMRRTHGGSIAEMELVETEVRQEIEKLRAARGFLHADSHSAAVKELQIIEQIQVLEAGLEHKDAAGIMKLQGQIATLKRYLNKAETAAKEAKAKADDHELNLAGLARWHEHLLLELEEERAIAAYRDMSLAQLEGALKAKEAERDVLRETAWLKGKDNPQIWADSFSTAQGAPVDEQQQGVGNETKAEGEQSSSDADKKHDDEAQNDAGANQEGGGDAVNDTPPNASLLHDISVRRCEVSAMHTLLLPHAIHAFRRVEARHGTAAGRVENLEARVLELKGAHEDNQIAQEQLREALERARSVEAEAAMLREKVERLEMEKRTLVDERDRARDSLSIASSKEKHAEDRLSEATEKLAHAEGQMSVLNTENMSLRTEAFSAVLAAKEAREIVAELEALRQKEERKWLDVQEEQTKKQSKVLTIRINDFQANRLGKPPSGPRVFVSSSISDFQKEREEIRASALPMLQAVCAQRGMVLSVVDLRFGLSDGDSTVGRLMPLILREIDECNYFTCFLGQQTGAFPLNYTKDAPGTGKKAQNRSSYSEFCTEMEANYILEQRLQWGGRAFFYLRDARSVDDVTATIDVPVTDAMTEAMLGLKQRISACGLKVVLDYMLAQDGVRAWRDDLQLAIEKDFPLDKEETAHVPVGVDGWRPRAFLECLEDKGHEAAFESRMAAYVRTNACDYTIAAIRDHVDKQGGSPLLITGPPGCGKATALAMFLAQYRQEVLAHDERALIQGITTRGVRSSPVSVLRTMMRMIKTHFKIDSPGIPDSESEVLSHGTLFSWLELGGLEGTIVMCIDLEGFADESNVHTRVRADGKKGGEEGSTTGGEWLGGDGADMRWLTAAQPAGANLIVTSSHPEALRTAREVYFWPVVEMLAMSSDDSQNLVQYFLGSRGLSLEGKRKEQIRSLRQQEMGNSLFLRVLLSEWVMLDTVGWKHDSHIDKIMVIRSRSIDMSVTSLFKLLLDRYVCDLHNDCLFFFLYKNFKFKFLNRYALLRAFVAAFSHKYPHITIF
jgi:hypothetical protein